MAETLVLVDAGGRLIGPVVAAVGGVFAEVRILAEGVDVPVSVRPGGFGEGAMAVGFETPDCTGAPWLVGLLPPSLLSFFQEAGVGPPRRLFVGAGPRSTPLIASRWVIPPGQAGECQAQPPAAEDALPATPVLDLGVFVPPFRIE
jgi:hypothetical protein